MKLSEFDYTLPDERIAQFPANQRGASRLLIIDKQTGALTHRHYADLVDYLQPGDVVVLNDTKVIKARLIAQNKHGKDRELLLIEQHGPESDNSHQRKALYRGKLRADEQLTLNGIVITVNRVLGGGIAEISSPADLLDLAETNGSVPLPPYMKRQATSADTERYQTVFAQTAGSVAAPTASLNFTQEIEAKLRAKGVIIAYLTLHVGLGTFLPIRTDDIEEHTMHSEYFEIPERTVRLIQAAKSDGHKICAIGTTVTRTLEYAHQEVLSQKPTILTGEANIFIYPGHEFKTIDAMLTNFHAPRTTVLMLAAAFGGWDNLKHAYDEAVAQKYDFLSYGDSMLII